MTTLPPMAEDEQDIAQRRVAALDQQRRAAEVAQDAINLARAAAEAMEEARRLMSFPMSTSVSWSEKIQRDE